MGKHGVRINTRCDVPTLPEATDDPGSCFGRWPSSASEPDGEDGVAEDGEAEVPAKRLAAGGRRSSAASAPTPRHGERRTSAACRQAVPRGAQRRQPDTPTRCGEIAAL